MFEPISDGVTKAGKYVGASMGLCWMIHTVVGRITGSQPV